MDITWYGNNCIGFKERDVRVLYDPFPEDPDRGANTQPELFATAASAGVETDEPESRIVVHPLGFEVDIVISSQRMNDAELAAFDGDTRVIAAPGEFEARGVFVQSLPLVSPIQPEALPSRDRLAHFMDFGTTRITHLGQAWASFRPRDSRLIENLIQKQTEILILPLGPSKDLDMHWALKLCRQIAPRVCIPVGYCPEEQEAIVSQLQTLGPVVIETQKRYRVKKDGDDEGTTTILLTPATLDRP